MRLFRYKTRNDKGQFSTWINVHDYDVTRDRYFQHWLFGRLRRKVAEKVFTIIKDIQK
jgi:hypothetical protein